MATHGRFLCGHRGNKLLAHFTAIRWEEHRPAWDYYDEYAPVLEDLTKRFEAALQGEVKEAYDAGYRAWTHHSPIVKVPSPVVPQPQGQG